MSHKDLEKQSTMTRIEVLLKEQSMSVRELMAGTIGDGVWSMAPVFLKQCF